MSCPKCGVMAVEIAKLKDRIAELEREISILRNVEEAESEALHKMRNECSKMVMDAQHKHLRCACEHGCPKEYAV